MCQNCQTNTEISAQIDFLRRYLENLQAQAEINPDKVDLTEELSRTRSLLARIEPMAAEKGPGR